VDLNRDFRRFGNGRHHLLHLCDHCRNAFDWFIAGSKRLPAMPEKAGGGENHREQVPPQPHHHCRT